MEMKFNRPPVLPRNWRQTNWHQPRRGAINIGKQKLLFNHQYSTRINAKCWKSILSIYCCFLSHKACQRRKLDCFDIIWSRQICVGCYNWHIQCEMSEDLYHWKGRANNWSSDGPNESVVIKESLKRTWFNSKQSNKSSSYLASLLKENYYYTKFMHTVWRKAWAKCI